MPGSSHLCQDQVRGSDWLGLVGIYNMGAVTPKASNHHDLDPKASRFVDVESLPSEQSQFPGVELKTLVIDEHSGLLTTRQGLLMRKLAVSEENAISVGNRTFPKSETSHLWLFHGHRAEP